MNMGPKMAKNVGPAKGAPAPDEHPSPKKLKILLRLGVYMMRYKGWLFAAFVLTLASNLLSLVGPKLSGYAIDAIELGTGRVDFRAVLFWCAMMAVFYVISSAFSYVLATLMIHLSQKIIRSMRSDIFTKLMKLPVSYFDRMQAGDIISRISYDVDTINASLSNDVIQIATSAITVIGSLIMMLTIYPPLCLIFAVTIPISLYFTRYMSMRVRPLFRRRSAKLGELNGYAEEMLSGLRAIKAYAREDAMCARFNERNDEAVEAYYNADYYGSIVGPSVNFINNLSMSLISAFGVILFLRGAVSLGNVSTFILYSRKFSGPINEFANILSELQSAASAAERVFRLLDETEELPDAKNALAPASISGSVGADHVRFGYTPDKMIIKDMCFDAKPGQTVAIVGPTGAGKTTVINLLERFYDVDAGEIDMDGVDIRGMKRASVRRAYTMVLQDTWLFSGTIADNIAYGTTGATDEQIRAAARAAHIDSFIESLPDGYNTLLTDDGINISKGQKQLLTIARAMMVDSPMLILDEATSNVDSRTEIKIQTALRALMQGRTCFVIAHRLSTVQNADVILVMRDGQIIERGTHDELLASGGFYASLYSAQFT